MKLRRQAALPPETLEPLAAFRGDVRWHFDARERLEQKLQGGAPFKGRGGVEKLLILRKVIICYNILLGIVLLYVIIYDLMVFQLKMFEDSYRYTVIMLVFCFEMCFHHETSRFDIVNM